MGNRDLEFLEDEMKIQALQQIRDEKINDKKQQRDAKKQSHRQTVSFKLASKLPHIWNTTCDKDSVDRTEVTSTANPETEVDEDDMYDAMSGLRSSPLNRKELKTRISGWVKDVNDALAAAEVKRKGRKSSCVWEQYGAGLQDFVDILDKMDDFKFVNGDLMPKNVPGENGIDD